MILAVIISPSTPRVRSAQGIQTFVAFIGLHPTITITWGVIDTNNLILGVNLTSRQGNPCPRQTYTERNSSKPGERPRPQFQKCKRRHTRSYSHASSARTRTSPGKASDIGWVLLAQVVAVQSCFSTRPGSPGLGWNEIVPRKSISCLVTLEPPLQMVSELFHDNNVYTRFVTIACAMMVKSSHNLFLSTNR